MEWSKLDDRSVYGELLGQLDCAMDEVCKLGGAQEQVIEAVCEAAEPQGLLDALDVLSRRGGDGNAGSSSAPRPGG